MGIDLEKPMEAYDNGGVYINAMRRSPGGLENAFRIFKQLLRDRRLSEEFVH